MKKKNVKGLWNPVTHLPSEQQSNGQIFGHISGLNPGVDISALCFQTFRERNLPSWQFMPNIQVCFVLTLYFLSHRQKKKFLFTDESCNLWQSSSVSMRKVAAMVGGGEIALSFGLNHHILGDQAKCQMLFVQVVKWREREREGKRGREGQKYTDTTCHHEGQIGGGRDVILHVKYSDWERNTERQRSLWPLLDLCVCLCAWTYVVKKWSHCGDQTSLIGSKSLWTKSFKYGWKHTRRG